MKKNSTLVYSTESGRIKQKPNKPDNPKPNRLPNDGIIRIQRETKGRKGKGVCVITGLTLEEKELKALSKSLKQVCGTGGSIKGNTIEIQGDNREKIKLELEKRGYIVKLGGG